LHDKDKVLSRSYHDLIDWFRVRFNKNTPNLVPRFPLFPASRGKKKRETELKVHVACAFKKLILKLYTSDANRSVSKCGLVSVNFDLKNTSVVVFL